MLQSRHNSRSKMMDTCDSQPHDDSSSLSRKSRFYTPISQPIYMSEYPTHLCALCSTIFDEPTSLKRLIYSGKVAEKGITFKRSQADLEKNSGSGCSLCAIIYDTLFRGTDGLALDPETILESDFNIPIHVIRVVAHMDDPDPYPLLLFHTMTSTSAPDTSTLDESFFAKLTMSAKAGNAAASLIRARPVSRDYRCDKAFEIIQQRIDQCGHDHPTCNIARGSSLPPRLIHIGDTCRVVETSGETGLYMALSYCWGMPSQPVMTTTKTIRHYKEALPMAQLPPVMLDAIHVTRRLGLKYLWVDALCILQDDKEDKTRQITRIPEIFNNAHLTISAAKTKTCAQSFLDTPSYDRDFADFEIPFKCPGGFDGNLVIQPYPYFAPYAEPIHSRGWTLEERLLSPRVLIYSKNFIIWQCRNDQYSITEERQEAGRSRDWKQDCDIQDFMYQNVNDPSDRRLDQLRSVWIALLEQYGRREVTDHRDRFRAIAGLASRLQHGFRNHKYVAGLWYSDADQDSKNTLLYQLLWKQLPLGDYLSHNHEENPIDLRAPSWSWASVGTMAQWRYKNMDSDATRFIDEWYSDGTANVIRCFSTPLVATHPFGRVENALVAIAGPLRTLESVLFSPDPEDQGFDEGVCEDADLTVFEFWCDKRFDRQGATEVSFLRLSQHAGLILMATTEEFRFQRVGMIQKRVMDARDRWKCPWDDHDTAGMDALFAKGFIKTVEIV